MYIKMWSGVCCKVSCIYNCCRTEYEKKIHEETPYCNCINKEKKKKKRKNMKLKKYLNSNENIK